MLLLVLFLLSALAAAGANAADCTTKQPFSKTVDSTLVSTDPTQIILNVPVTLSSAFDLTVDSDGGSPNAWSVNGYALVDPATEKLGSTITFDASTKIVTITVGSGIGNAGVSSLCGNTLAAGMLSSAMVGSALGYGENQRALVGAASAMAIFSMSTLMAAADTATCTPQGELNVVLASGWIATQDLSSTNADNGKFVYDLLKTVSPTGRPTIPTLSPTNEPTNAPTTPNPTLTPTRSPTKPPTTKAPSRSPTKAPSRSPTKNPTMPPTTRSPTPPTHIPSRNPTASPTLPFTAFFNEIEIIKDHSVTPSIYPFVEIMVYGTITDPSTISFYYYQADSNNNLLIDEMFNEPLSTAGWAKNATVACAQSPFGVIYSKSWTDPSTFQDSNSQSSTNMAFGITVAGVQTELLTFVTSGLTITGTGTFAGKTATIANGANTVSLGTSTGGAKRIGAVDSNTWANDPTADKTPGYLNVGETCN